jgi:hypothetical protein
MAIVGNEIRTLKIELSRLNGRIGNHSVAFRRFENHMRTQMIDHFQELRLGGTNRGVTWAYFKTPVYVRKTDGVAVPPWGGVPRLAASRAYQGTAGWRLSVLGSFSNRNRNSGSSIVRDRRSTVKERTVRGHLRPSGKRLKEGDSILQDTRRLLTSLTSVSGMGAIRERGPLEMRFGTAVAYAEVHNRTRPFLFFTNGDRDTLERMILEGTIGGTGGNR